MKETDIAKMLPPSIVDAMSEESLSVLKEEFEKAVEQRVAERIDIATSAAEAALDEEVNHKCTELVHQIEEAHKLGLIKVVKSLNEQYEKRLENVRNYYKNQIGRKALAFKNKLLESVSDYIEARIDKLVPYKQIKEAVANNSAMKVLETFKNILNVSEVSSNNSIKNAVLEGYSMINSEKEKSAALNEENKHLKSVIKDMSENYAFERNISKLDEDTKNFVIRLAKKSGVEYVNENMSYICGLYEKNLSKEREKLKNREISKRIKKNNAVNRRVLAEQYGSDTSYKSGEDEAVDSLISEITDEDYY